MVCAAGLEYLRRGSCTQCAGRRRSRAAGQPAVHARVQVWLQSMLGVQSARAVAPCRFGELAFMVQAPQPSALMPCCFHDACAAAKGLEALLLS